MALKQKYAGVGDIPAELKSFYVERDGAWVLDTERDPKIEEMRTSNVNLLKEIATWKQRFDGIDPEAVRKLADEKRQLEEAAQLKAGEFEKVLASRLAEQAKGFAPVKGELEAANVLIAKMVIEDAVVAEATKRGLRPTALVDLKARARAEFREVGGVPQVFVGGVVQMGVDGITPQTVPEWVDALGPKAPHLFDGNTGGGAAGSGAGGAARGGGVVNPWDEKTKNLTEQVKLMKSDPSLAARLKASAK